MKSARRVVEPELIHVPAGPFLMGTSDEQVQALLRPAVYDFVEVVTSVALAVRDRAGEPAQLVVHWRQQLLGGGVLGEDALAGDLRDIRRLQVDLEREAIHQAR